jgi:hypothetical protein
MNAFSAIVVGALVLIPVAAIVGNLDPRPRDTRTGRDLCIATTGVRLMATRDNWAAVAATVCDAQYQFDHPTESLTNYRAHPAQR